MKSISSTYRSIHKWLDRKFKTPKMNCEHCDISSEIKRLTWAKKKGVEHARSRENYLRLCFSCHKKYDMTDEFRKKTGIISKLRQTPEYRKKHGDRIREILKNPEKRKLWSEATRNQWKNPGHREKVSVSLKKYWANKKLQHAK